MSERMIDRTELSEATISDEVAPWLRRGRELACDCPELCPIDHDNA